MKTKICLVASALLMAGPALAQEPLEKTGTEPSTQMAAPPNPGMPGAEPIEQVGTEQTKQGAPEASQTPEPLEAAGTSQDKGQAADAPATIVVTDLTEVDDNKKLVAPWGLPADSVSEMDVYDAAGQKIGEVDAVLQDKNGEIKGVAVGYGGFLGFGEKGAIVTLDQVKLKDGTLVTDLTEDQLSEQPAWPKK